MGMIRDAHDIIVRPILTEKLTELRETQRKIGLRVRPDATKIEIKKAAELVLKVKITKVNVLHVIGKTRRIGRLSGKKPDWKKAIVTMKAGEKLEIFEGV
jgi:large subunit ribosomal protein L23